MTDGFKSCTVFAPATVANVASGFDILGFAISTLGDRVTVSRSKAIGVTLGVTLGVTIEVSGASKIASTIPSDPKLNTAGVPLLQMLEDLKPGYGLSVQIEKGIPLGSGLGGSAASAVGAVVAADLVIGSKLSKEQLIEYALMGEAIASGSKHADNIAPCLYGGLTLSHPGDQPQVVSLPYPKSLYCVVVHPSMTLNTKDARAVLKTEIKLKDHSKQSVYLAALVAGFCTSDFDLISRGLHDILVEPDRAKLIPGFNAVKTAALKSGAMGCSISGAGPSLFAFAKDKTTATQVGTAMVHAFQEASGLTANAFVSVIEPSGARAL